MIPTVNLQDEQFIELVGLSSKNKVSLNLQEGTTGSDLFLNLGGNGGLLGGAGSDVCFTIVFLLPLAVFDDLHTGDFSIQSL
jgi:hypothetical protein